MDKAINKIILEIRAGAGRPDKIGASLAPSFYIKPKFGYNYNYE